MDSHTSHEIDCAAFAAFKRSRKDHLKIDFPNLKDQEIEKRLAGEWRELTENEKMPFIKIVEDNPFVFRGTCESDPAHNKIPLQ
jgi:hypothetical protein